MLMMTFASKKGHHSVQSYKQYAPPLLIIAVLAAVIGCAQNKPTVTLHLDGWRRLTDEEAHQINPTAPLPPHGMWLHPETGAFFTFSEHTANSTAKDIKAALAGVADGAIKGGVVPMSVEHTSEWDLPTFNFHGVMKRGDATIDATYLYALGQAASYSTILLQHRGQPKVLTQSLVYVVDDPNPMGAEVTKEVVAVATPKLDSLRTKMGHGE